MTVSTRTGGRGLRALVLSAVGALTGVVLAAGGIAASSDTAQASHYRADQIEWHVTTGNTVMFHLGLSTSASYFNYPAPGSTISAGALDYGDGAREARVPFTVGTVDRVNNVLTAEAVLTHSFASEGPFTVTFSDCCRLLSPTHINNSGADSILTTTVDLANAQASPSSAISPIVDCPIEAVCAFRIPAIGGTAGSELRYRLATTAESGIVSQPGPPYSSTAAEIDPVTGVYTWDTARARVNATGFSFYSTQVVIEEYVDGALVASLPIDFFIRLSGEVTNAAPVFEAPTPADGAEITVSLGFPVSFGVQASDPDPGDIVTPGILQLPAGAVFDPVPGNPATASFDWTPTALGDYILILTAQDQQGLQSVQRSIVVHVVPMADEELEPEEEADDIVTLAPEPSGSAGDPQPAGTEAAGRLAATGSDSAWVGALAGSAVFLAVAGAAIVVILRRRPMSR